MPGDMKDERGKDKRIPPDPGGYLVQYHFGLGDHWHSYNGKDLHGPAAIDKFNQYASNPIPGGRGRRAKNTDD
jgi:hypothetical protein